MEHGAVYRQGLPFITILTLTVIIVDFIILELCNSAWRMAWRGVAMARRGAEIRVWSNRNVCDATRCNVTVVRVREIFGFEVWVWVALLSLLSLYRMDTGVPGWFS